jgi:hypothetical protein
MSLKAVILVGGAQKGSLIFIEEVVYPPLRHFRFKS